VQLLLRCACKGREEEDFKSFSPLSLSSSLAQKTHMTHTHTTIPCKHYGRKIRRKHALPAAPITHLTLRHGRGKVILSSSAYKYQRRNQQ